MLLCCTLQCEKILVTIKSILWRKIAEFNFFLIRKWLSWNRNPARICDIRANVIYCRKHASHGNAWLFLCIGKKLLFTQQFFVVETMSAHHSGLLPLLSCQMRTADISPRQSGVVMRKDTTLSRLSSCLLERWKNIKDQWVKEKTPTNANN